MPHFVQLASIVASPTTLQFLVIVAVGMSVGLAFAIPCALDCRLTTMALIAVGGAWIGANAFTSLAAAPQDVLAQIAPGALGAVLAAHLWRLFHPAGVRAHIAQESARL